MPGGSIALELTECVTQGTSPPHPDMISRADNSARTDENRCQFSNAAIQRSY